MRDQLIETMKSENTTAAVLLAAGSGSRFAGGQHKLRAVIDDRSVLQHSIDAALAGGFDEVAVVIGEDDFSDIITDDVETISSPDWALGQSRSLAAAVQWATEKGLDSIVVGVGDQPLVGSRTWDGLRTATSTPIASASFAGKKRPPVRLHSSVWSELPTDGDTGARDLVRGPADRITEVPSAGDPIDVDTVEALEEVRRRYNDRLAVRELLGREPMGAFEVVVSNDEGQPVVLKNFPILVDGRPMPTLYWLCGERESMLIGRLEAMKGVRRAEADIGLDAINSAHKRYEAERDAIVDALSVRPKHVPSGGVGGTRNGVKCLHAHYGYWLAGGDDPVGQWVADHLHEVDSPNWPATTDPDS